MIETQTHQPSSHDTETATVFVVSFTGSTDSQERRIRYIRHQDHAKLWRVEERRHDGDWQLDDIEPVESLRFQQPDRTDRLTPQPEPTV